MCLYLVAYDLLDESRDYSEFYNGIKSLGIVSHPLENLWFIYTNVYSVDMIYEILKPKIRERDMLMCMRVQADEIKGFVGRTFWNWLKMLS